MRFRIILGFVVICLIWGSTWLGIKLGIETIPPIFAACLRFLLASLILGAIMLAGNIDLPREVPFLRLAVNLGVTSFSVPFALVYWGESRIESGLAAILFATFPFFVALFSQWLLPNERMSTFKLAGVTAGFAGILIIFRGGFDLAASTKLLGMAAVVTSSLLQAFSLIQLRKHGSAYSPVATNFASMLIATFILMIMTLVFENHSHMLFDAKSVGSILYLGSLGSVATFVTYFWLAKHVEAVFLSLSSFVTPIVAVFLGSVILNEQLGANVLLGASCVVGGIALANAPDIIAVIRKGRSLIRT